MPKYSNKVHKVNNFMNFLHIIRGKPGKYIPSRSTAVRLYIMKP